MKTRPSSFSRFMTLLYYLNDVEDGGETAFPVADNETFDQQVTRTTNLIQTYQSAMRTPRSGARSIKSLEVRDLREYPKFLFRIFPETRTNWTTTLRGCIHHFVVVTFSFKKTAPQRIDMEENRTSEKLLSSLFTLHLPSAIFFFFFNQCWIRTCVGFNDMYVITIRTGKGVLKNERGHRVDSQPKGGGSM